MPVIRAPITQPDEVGDKNLRAELSQLYRAHVSHDKPDEETDQRNNTQRARADVLDDQEQIRAAVLCLASKKAPDGKRDFTQEFKHGRYGAVGRQGGFADTRQ